MRGHRMYWDRVLSHRARQAWSKCATVSSWQTWSKRWLVFRTTDLLVSTSILRSCAWCVKSKEDMSNSAWNVNRQLALNVYKDGATRTRKPILPSLWVVLPALKFPLCQPNPRSSHSNASSVQCKSRSKISSPTRLLVSELGHSVRLTVLLPFSRQKVNWLTTFNTIVLTLLAVRGLLPSL